MKRNFWTREDLFLVMNLYCKTVFGQMHMRNPDVIKLAKHIGRTPSAVAMKLVNFASLDPALKQRGLSASSKLDKEVWKEFFANETVVDETELVSETLYQETADEYFVEDAMTISKTRRLQRFFRKSVIANYGEKCCITGMSVPELLIASHIVPWSKDKRNRLNPQNGLCLNALHDKAFDIGLISIDASFKVMVSPMLPQTHENSYILDFVGVQITPPEKFLPDPAFLDYHRTHIFRNP